MVAIRIARKFSEMFGPKRKIPLLTLLVFVTVFVPHPALAQVAGSCSPKADFLIEASPHTLILQSSSAGSSTITLTPIDGFLGTATLTPTNVPTDIINPMLTPSTLDLSGGPQTSTLTFQTSSVIMPGEYSFDINGTTTTTLFQFTSITVRVPAPGFSIAASQSYLAIEKPSVGSVDRSVDLTVTSLYKFVDTVNLMTTVSGAARAIPPISSVIPSSVTLGAGLTAPSALKITVSSTTTLGSYTVYVSGTSVTYPAVSNSTSIGVTVTGPDFLIIPKPFELMVSTGHPQSSTINVTSMDNFAGTVDLTAKVSSLIISNPTATLSTYFLPTSVSVSSGSWAKSELTVSTTTGTVPGDYLVTVNGTSGSLFSVTAVLVAVPGAPGFSISPTPSTLTIQQGAFAKSSVLTLNSLNSFQGKVDLSVDCSPEGLTASLDMSSVIVSASGPVTATLSVSASSFTVPGTYDVDVSGSNFTLSTFTNVSNMTTIKVMVTGPDFTLDASPASVPLTVGGMGTSTITATPQNGFSGTVKLTTQVLAFPVSATGLTVSLTSSSLDLRTGQKTSTLTLTANAPGYYTVEITGTSWPLIHTIDVSVVVTNAHSTSTYVTCDSSITVNQASSCTATVTDNSPAGTAVTPTGSVSFTVMGVGSVSPPTCLLTNGMTIGTATCSGESFTSTVSGSATVKASYAGDSIHSASSGTTGITINTVTKHDTSTSLTCASPVVVGQASTCTANVKDVSTSGSTTPTGTVSFTSTGSGSLSTPPSCTLTSGSCHVTFTPSAVGTATVTASYAGDPTHNTSTSAAASITVSTGPAPNFSLNSNPSSLTITQGSSATSTITISPQNGFTGAVALSATSTAGITASFSPSSIYGPNSGYGSQSSTMTVSVDSSVAPGSYTVTVTGTSSSLAPKLAIPITVSASPSQVPPAQTTIFGLQPIVFYGLVGGIVAVVAVAGGVTVVLRRRKS